MKSHQLPDRQEGAWTEWEYVMCRVLQEDQHPSDDHLKRLIREDGVPAFAREYVASRINRGPGKTPMREPENWEMFGVFSSTRAGALMDLVHLWHELSNYRSTDPGPRGARKWRRTIQTDCLLPLDSESLEAESVEVDLWRPKSCDDWRVRMPKETATAIVADRHGIQPGTLKRWDRQFRTSLHKLGQVF